jgi:glycosyltransferase involved in cell wall biosynthesis
MPQEIRLVAYTNAENVGGAERCLATILAGLPPAFRVTLVATNGAVAEAILVGGGLSAEIASVHPPRELWDLRTVIAHRDLLRRLDPDLCVINLHTPYSGLHATLAAVLVPRLRVVAIEHLPLPSLSRGAHLLKRMTSRRLAAHVAVSEHTAETIATEAGLPRGRMLVVRNGVAEPAVGEIEMGSRPAVGGLGRLDPQKGFDVLIDALALLPGVSGVVAGDGPEREALMRRARDRSVADRFSILGWESQIGPLLRSLDVFVLPSRYEGLPLALLEAMASGAAVVAADVGAVGEAVVSGKTGLLVPPDDPKALAAGIRQLLDDRGLRQRLGAEARAAWAAEFTAERMQQDYTDLFRGLVR